MEGTLRQAGSKLRLAVQLADSESGAHLWAESYERKFSPDAIFELQDDLVPRIVSTVADQYGVLPHSMSESLRGKSDDQLTPHEAVIRSFGYLERLTPDEHAQVRRILENAVRQAPGLSDAWVQLCCMYWHEYAQRFNPQPDPLGRALAGLVADMAQDAALAFTIRRRVLAPRRRSMRKALERARVRGEARDGLDVELVLDMLTGPFYFRTLFGHAPMSLKTTREVVDCVLRVIRPNTEVGAG